MAVTVQEAGEDSLTVYAKVSIAYEVTSVLRCREIDGGIGGISLREEDIERPYIKDYDACDSDRPEEWPKRFDINNWGFFLAADGTRAVGGAAIAFNTDGVHMLSGRKDLAVLWDIRVHPHFRGRGIGTALFNAAADWSRKRSCSQLKIETQNVNVPACRFYAKQGCHLGEINRYGYAGDPKVAHEVMLVWYLDL